MPKIARAKLVPPDERAGAIVTFERQVPVVAGAAHPDQPELAFGDERSRHDVRIVAVGGVESRRRA